MASCNGLPGSRPPSDGVYRRRSSGSKEPSLDVSHGIRQRRRIEAHGYTAGAEVLDAVVARLPAATPEPEY